MMKFFQKKNKKGVTLVESMIAVALLSFAATGILTMLVVSGTKIFKLGGESAAYAEVTQQMDLVIAAISNSPSAATDYIDPTTGDLKPGVLKSTLGLDDTDISAEISLYDTTAPQVPSKVRGWYLTLKYKGATVTGFASNTEGAFDH